MSALPRRSGFTLVEVIVVLAVMGISAGLATVAFRSLIPESDTEAQSWAGQVRSARRRAVSATTPFVLRSADKAPILFLPDGRVVGEGFDPLTGVLEGPT